MSWLDKINASNFLPKEGNGRFQVYSKQFNDIVDDLKALFPSALATNHNVTNLGAVAPQSLSGAGAITLTEYKTEWTTTGADAGTLANGTAKGQLKKIKMIVDGGDGTLTPTSLSGGTTITFSEVGDEVLLCWNGTAWVLIDDSSLLGTGATPVLA